MRQQQSPKSRADNFRPLESVPPWRSRKSSRRSFRFPSSCLKKSQELSIQKRASMQSIIVSVLQAEFANRGLTI